VPFLASAILIAIGVYVRFRVMETPVFREAAEKRHKREANPAMAALTPKTRSFFVVHGARMAENGLGYPFPVFGLTYVTTMLGMPRVTLAFVLAQAVVWAACLVRMRRISPNCFLRNDGLRGSRSRVNLVRCWRVAQHRSWRQRWSRGLAVRGGRWRATLLGCLASPRSRSGADRKLIGMTSRRRRLGRMNPA
jgi:hypothetical protein